MRVNIEVADYIVRSGPVFEVWLDGDTFSFDEFFESVFYFWWKTLGGVKPYMVGVV